MKKSSPGPASRFPLARSLAPAALLLAAMSSLPLYAANDSWDGQTDGTWGIGSNWSLDTTPPGTGETATFDGAGNGNTTIDLGGGVVIGSVVFNTSSAAAYTIGSGGAGTQTLSFANAGALTINSGVATSQLVNANVQLNATTAASTTFTNNGTGTLTIAGSVNANVASDNGLLTVTGSGNTAISGAITKTGAGSHALLKTGSGTLTLSNGSVWSGAGALGHLPPISVGFPLVVREGNLKLAGGTHSVTGELVIGGAVTHGGAGQNAKLQVDAGSLAVSSWLSVGRGNGTGVATSDLELNNSATVTAADFSAGFNANNTANMPRGTITLNDSASLSVSTALYIAESAGSNFTLNLNGTSQLRQTGTSSGETRVGAANTAVGIINVNGGTASFERDVILGYLGSGAGNLVLNSGTVNVASTIERGLVLGRAGTAAGNLIVNGGTLNLNANSDIRLSTTTTAVGANVISLNGGQIVGGTGSVVDLKQNTGATSNSTFNLNGGTLTIAQVITTQNTATATVVFNFNGGTLRAATTNANFLDLGGSLQRANVRNGGAVIDSNGSAVTIPEALLHSNVGGDDAIDGGLTKNGLGTLTLSSVSTYTGGTTVNAGILALSPTGSITSSTSYTIANGAEFDVSAKSFYALSGVTISIGLDASTGGFFDAGAAQLDFTNGNLDLRFSTESLIDGHTYNLFDFDSQIGGLVTVHLSGDFDGFLARSGDIWNGTSGAFAFSFNEADGTLTVSAVPEPSAFAALAGLLGLGFAASSRRRR